MQKTILFVDKDALFAEQMRQTFMAQGYRVMTTRNEDSAEEIFSASRPDILITEVMLNHPDGGFCLAWKLKKKYPEVPVIMVSSVTWHADMRFSLTSPGGRDWIKADVFLDKPIRTEELMSAVKSVLQPNKAATQSPS